MTGSIDRDWLDAAYERHLAAHMASSEHDADWGYSFFYCPVERLRSATVGIVGLNPGGGGRPSDPPPPQNRSWDHPGFAYLDQPWGSDGALNPLQIQIARLLELTGVDDKSLFAAQLVPFRSPSWSRLPNRTAAVDVFEPIWREMLARTSVRLWFTLGYVAGERLRCLAGAGDWTPAQSGWGTTQIKIAQNSDGMVVVALPHLSRYKLFSQSGERLALAENAVRQAVKLAGLKGP